MIVRKVMKTYIDELDRNIFPFVQYADFADRYPARTAQAFARDFYDELRAVSGGLYSVFKKTTEVFQQAPYDFARAMDMPENLLPYLYIPNTFAEPTWLSRFDFVLDKRGRPKMVEINADTPCFFIESYYANGVAAKYMGKEDANAGAMENLRRFLKQVYDSSCVNTENCQSGPFVFSCFDDYKEDYGTTLFLKHTRESVVPNGDIRFLSFYDLEIDENGIVLPDDSHAAGLYRLHPMEILIDEETEAGEPLGAMFLDLYEKHCFSMMNPPEAIIPQNKSFMALVWALAQTERFFTRSERDLVECYLTPSYFEDDFASLADGTYVRKDIWGREGVNIKIIEKTGTSGRTVAEKYVEHKDEVVRRPGTKGMYQQYIRQPHFTHTADSGTLEGFLTLSCFMLFDRPSAVGARFSPEAISGIEAYFVPLVVE